MQTATELTGIPLSALHLSPLNARKTRTGDVDDLASSIAAHGLLQNLTVTVNSNPGEFEVVAGGRRLAAMQQLEREGRLPASLASGVPCLVIEDNDAAHEASTAENTLRENMHPADQFEAFKRMVDQGKSVADVAAHFGISENVVRQRMKLANVNPQFIAMYREGGIELEQLQALALTDDHEEQRKAWFGVKNSWERSARELRNRITKAEVGPEHALAKFVGVDAYEAAGGPIRRDLFTNAVYFGDVALLEKLALDILNQHAQQDREAGWSWVDVHLSLDSSGVAEYSRSGIEPAYTPPDKASKQRLAEIESQGKALIEEQENLPGEGEYADDRYNEIEQLLQGLDEERARLDRGTENWPDSAKQKTGVVMWIDRHDGLRIVRGLLRPGQKADKSGAITGTPKPAPGAKPAQPVKKPEIGATLLRELSAHRSEAARFAVARDPQLALALQIDWLLGALDYGRDSELLRMRSEPARRAVDIARDVSKALQVTEDLPAVVAAKKVPKASRLAWLIKQAQGELLAMFAYLVATRFDGIDESDRGHAGVAVLHDAIGFDMTQYWTPACDDFLGRLPKALILLIVEEAAKRKGIVDPKGFVEMANNQKGKDAVVAYASKVLAGSGWLPKTLRGSGYDKPTAKSVVAKKAPAKKAKPAKKKAAAKKPAAKKPAPKSARKGA